MKSNDKVAPAVRGALHAGRVVIGEVGESKQEIVFHGDVMNATARLEQAWRAARAARARSAGVDPGRDPVSAPRRPAGKLRRPVGYEGDGAGRVCPLERPGKEGGRTAPRSTPASPRLRLREVIDFLAVDIAVAAALALVQADVTLREGAR
jgi:hypothetical protein